MALVAGSTIAGNLAILGVVSNIIVFEAAESEEKKAFFYFEFAKIDMIATFVDTVVYSFLTCVPCSRFLEWWRHFDETIIRLRCALCSEAWSRSPVLEAHRFGW